MAWVMMGFPGSGEKDAMNDSASVRASLGKLSKMVFLNHLSSPEDPCCQGRCGRPSGEEIAVNPYLVSVHEVRV